MTLEYYPFGLKQKGYNDTINGGNALAQAYKFGGKEYQQEFDINWYDISARNYDPALGRWMNIDLLAELYDDSSPYNYVKNNPIIFVDPDGMKVDISEIFRNDKGFAEGVQLLLDLSEQTGLSLSVNSKDGLLNYAKDENGEAIIEESGGVNLGSEDARSMLISAIGHDDTVKVGSNLGTSSFVNEKDGKAINEISLGVRGIESNISGVSSGLNPRTMGYGMTFLHELSHTPVGGSTLDTEEEGEKGPTVTRMNRIREQLDNNPLNRILGRGSQYGIRKSYSAEEVSRKSLNPRIDLVVGKVFFTILNKKGRKTKASIKTERRKRK